MIVGFHGMFVLMNKTRETLVTISRFYGMLWSSLVVVFLLVRQSHC